MAGSVNKCILIGNVGKDPEIRSTTHGGQWAGFSIATTESWRDKATGERKDRTQWHNVVVFNEPLVKLVEQYVRKGSKLYVEGQVETRQYDDRDGNKRYATEIVLRPFRGEITLLGDSGASRRDPEAGAKTRETAGGGYAGVRNGTTAMRDVIDDDICHADQARRRLRLRSVQPRIRPPDRRP